MVRVDLDERYVYGGVVKIDCTVMAPVVRGRADVGMIACTDLTVDVRWAMRARIVGKALGLAAAIVAAAGLVWIGRETVHTASPPGDTVSSDAYFAGLRVGEAQGRQEGRALQEGASLPRGSRQPVADAFNAGYAAGTNDAFAGYDGGWSLSVPYVITVEEGSGQIVYRISSRTPFAANINYYLCADRRDLCEERRR